jgi:hypothetical protein
MSFKKSQFRKENGEKKKKIRRKGPNKEDTYADSDVDTHIPVIPWPGFFLTSYLVYISPT